MQFRSSVWLPAGAGPRCGRHIDRAGFSKTVSLRHLFMPATAALVLTRFNASEASVALWAFAALRDRLVGLSIRPEQRAPLDAAIRTSRTSVRLSPARQVPHPVIPLMTEGSRYVPAPIATTFVGQATQRHETARAAAPWRAHEHR